MKKKFIVWLFAALVFHSEIFAEENETADVLTKAAIAIFSPDFIQGDLKSIFSPEELEILSNQKQNLSELISSALNKGNSVTGADFIAHFSLVQSMPELRFRFLQPDVPYGWEVPNYSNEENYLTDNQYVFHSRYHNALFIMYGVDTLNEIDISIREKEEIIDLSNKPKNKYYFWARWMRSKLGF